MEEVWKQVVGYEGLYEVSDLGRLKNVKTKYITDGHRSQSGYAVTGLRMNNKSKASFLHRLVAIAFIENPENKPCVNHKNGLRHDNRVINLEWATVRENIVHGYGLKKSGKQRKYKHVSEDYELDELTLEERRDIARKRLTELHYEWKAKQNKKLYGS